MRRRTNRTRTASVGVLCTLALAMMLGCRQQQSGTSGPRPAGGPTVSASSASTYQVLRKGSRAFNFLVAPGGQITVFDVTAGRPLVSTQVPPQTLVRVDPATGIFTGSTQLMKGPLPANHVRELRLQK